MENNSGGQIMPENKLNTNKIIGMGVVAVGALVLLLLLSKIFGLFMTPAYEKPVKLAIQAMQDGDADKMMKALPDYVSDQMEAYMGFFDLEDSFKFYMDILEGQYGKNIKFSYKVKDKKKLGKSEIESIKDNVWYTYEEDVKIKAAYTLNVEIKIKGSNDKDTQEVDIDVIKIGSDWYLKDSMM